MGHEIAHYRESGTVINSDWLHCGTCVSACPRNTLQKKYFRLKAEGNAQSKYSRPPWRWPVHQKFQMQIGTFWS